MESEITIKDGVKPKGKPKISRMIKDLKEGQCMSVPLGDKAATQVEHVLKTSVSRVRKKHPDRIFQVETDLDEKCVNVFRLEEPK